MVACDHNRWYLKTVEFAEELICQSLSFWWRGRGVENVTSYEKAVDPVIFREAENLLQCTFLLSEPALTSNQAAEMPVRRVEEPQG